MGKGDDAVMNFCCFANLFCVNGLISVFSFTLLAAIQEQWIWML